jgi:hypothetical protein
MFEQSLNVWVLDFTGPRLTGTGNSRDGDGGPKISMRVPPDRH